MIFDCFIAVYMCGVLVVLGAFAFIDSEHPSAMKSFSFWDRAITACLSWFAVGGLLAQISTASYSKQSDSPSASTEMKES